MITAVRVRGKKNHLRQSVIPPRFESGTSRIQTVQRYRYTNLLGVPKTSPRQTIEQCYPVVSTPALYSGGSRLESRFGNQNHKASRGFQQ
jgi:hypothetical protein